MVNASNQPDDAATADDTATAEDTIVDPIDEEAASIDPRSPEASEQIAELIDDAEALGRDPDQPKP